MQLFATLRAAVRRLHAPLLVTPLLVAALLAGPSAARAIGWTPLGPDVGQQAPAVAAAPGSPPVVYAATAAGIFRRTGDGPWQAALSGIPRDARANRLAVSPADPDRVVCLCPCGTPLVSEDGGRHWVARGDQFHPLQALLRPFEALALHPDDPDVLYIGGLGGIFRSTDGGRTFEPSYDGILETPVEHEEVTALGISPIDPDVLFAGTINLTSGLDTVHVYRSDDAGASWHGLDAGQRSESLVTDFAFDPVDPDTVYLANRGTGAFRTRDGGATWTPIDTGLPSHPDRFSDEPRDVIPVGSIEVDPAHAGTLYASLGHDGLFKTTDGGDSWQAVSAGFPPGSTVGDLAVSPDHPERWIVTTGSGPWVSTTGGASWEPAESGMPARTQALAVGPESSGRLVVGTAAQGLLTSPDGGANWLPVETPDVRRPQEPGLAPLDLPRTPVHDLVLLPGTDPPVLLLATSGYREGSPADGTARFGLLRSTDLGATWQEANDGLPDPFVERLVVKPAVAPDTVPDVLAVAGGAMVVSHDRGATWNVLFAPPEPVRAVAFDPSHPAVLFAATGGESAQHRAVHRSNDGGATWTEVFTFPEHSRPVTSLLIIPAIAKEGGPDGASTVLAGLEARLPANQPGTDTLFRSLDGGDTWELADGDLPAVDVTDLALDPDDPTVVWVGTAGAGAYRSADRGATWTPISSGLENRWIERLIGGGRTLDQRGLHGALYAVTRGGVHRLEPNAAAAEPPPPAGPWIEDPTFPGFRFKVRITNQADASLQGAREPTCLPETVCVSGALPGRSEVFVRIVGPKPNGYLWPTLVKLSTSTVEVWIERTSDGLLRYYELPGARPGFDELPGLFDRYGFPPEQQGF